MLSDSTNIVCPHCDVVNKLPTVRLADNPNCGKCHKALFLAKSMTLTDTNFQRHVSRNDIPMVVDFWASWCGPCKQMAPFFEDAAAQLEPKVRLAKLNTEQAQELAAKFNIRSIPTLVMFRDGKESARQSGAMSASDIIKWITTHA